MSKQRDRMLKKIISIGLALLMTMSIVTLFLGAEAGLGIYRKSNLMVAITESSYQSKSYEEFSRCYRDVLDANGFDDMKTDIAFNESRFKSDLGNSIKASLKGKTYTLSTRSEVRVLREALIDNLINKGYVIDEPTKNAMEAIAGQVESYYKNYSQFAFGNYYYKAKKTMEHRLKIGVPIAIGVLILSGIAIYMINRNRRHRFFRYTKYALLGATVPCLYVFYKVGTAANAFSNEGGYYYDMIGSLYNFSIAPLVFAEIFLILGFGILYKLEKDER